MEKALSEDEGRGQCGVTQIPVPNACPWGRCLGRNLKIFGQGDKINGSTSYQINEPRRDKVFFIYLCFHEGRRKSKNQLGFEHFEGLRCQVQVTMFSQAWNLRTWPGQESSAQG